jgi:hypothetical protein
VRQFDIDLWIRLITKSSIFSRHEFFFCLAGWSDHAGHRGRSIVLLDNNRCACTQGEAKGWVRSSIAIPPRSGLWRWILHFGSEDGGKVYQAGVVSDQFSVFNSPGGSSSPHSWFVQNDSIWLDAVKQGTYQNGKFSEGDMVAFELNRPVHGDTCSMRVINLRTRRCTVSINAGLPIVGTLYAAASVLDQLQAVTLVQAPTRVDSALQAEAEAASPTISAEVAFELLHDLALEASKLIK